MKLEALILSENQEMAKVFDQAVEYLKPQICLPLWLTWAQWSEDAGKQEDTEAIYKRAIFGLPGAGSVPVKEMYLNWAYRSGGYKKARDVFKRYLQTCSAVTCLSTPYSAPCNQIIREE